MCFYQYGGIVYSMDKNSASNVYVLTKGEASDYSIVSVWLSEEEATRNCAQLNAGIRYGDYEVGAYPIGTFLGGSDEASKVPGFRATYDFGKHGWDVKKETVVFSEALMSWVTEPTLRTPTEVFVVNETEAECLKAIEDFVLVKLSEVSGDSL